MNAAFIAALADIPEGASLRRWRGQSYQTTKTTLQSGRLIKLYGEGLAAKDHISFNFYRLASGDQLSPCEMPEEKVISFVTDSTAVDN